MRPSGFKRRCYAVLAMLFVGVFPATAYADGALGCYTSGPNAGTPIPQTELYDTTASCNNATTDATHVFSKVVCTFQSILDTVLDSMYCGIQYYFVQNILTPLLTLYVAVFGLQILMGTAQLNARDIIIRMLKISAVIAFATQSAWGIGIAFDFFMAFVTEGTSWVISPMMTYYGSECGTSGINWQDTTTGQFTEQAFYNGMDTLIYNALIGPLANTNASVLGFFGVMAVAFPALFSMAVYWLWTTFTLLLRAVLSYIMGISAIAFLIALSPIFLSFMLFKITFHFFDNWMQYVVSYTLQIVILFAAIAMWVAVMNFFPNFLNALSSLIYHFTGALGADPVPIGLKSGGGAVFSPTDTWAICPYSYSASQTICAWTGPWISGSCPAPGTANPTTLLLPSDIPTQQNLILFIIFNLSSWVLVNYAFGALLQSIPEVAQQLAGPQYVPLLRGGFGTQSFGSFKGAADSAMGKFEGMMPGAKGRAGRFAKEFTEQLGKKLRKDP